MKNNLFYILSIFSFIIPVKFLIKLTGIRIIYPFYHIVNDNQPPHIKHLYSARTIKQFRKDLDFLRRYFHNTKDVLKNSNDKQNYFHLSFDDGLSECYDVIAPILKEYNIKATFFINSGFVDNKDLFFKYKASIIVEEIKQKGLTENQKTKISTVLLSKRLLNINQIIRYILNITYFQKQKLDKIADILEISFYDYLQKHKPYISSHQIKELIKDGHQIGSHSIDHPLFSNLSEKEQIRQTSESIQYTENEFDVKAKLFAFPFTDDQVKTSFFNTVFNNKIIDYSFGTAGIKKDSITKNIQRIPIEKKSMSAERYIKTEYLLYFLKRLIQKNRINRK